MRPDAHPHPTAALLRDGAELASWPLVRRCPDLSLVDDLARLQLAARRVGCSIVVRGAGADLCRLLELVGLDGVLAVEVGGQPEGAEEPGVEEVVVADDPVA